MKRIISIVLAACLLLSMAVMMTACGEQKKPNEEPKVESPWKVDASTKVTVTGGEIVGYSEGDIIGYKSIPFAAAPVGDLRWQDPRPVTPWEGTKECVAYGPSFFQPASADGEIYTQEYHILNEYGRKEDALTLNVWAPKDTSTPKAVLVYIHGGAFSSGSGSIEIYDGTQLAQQGIVYVTINYRLGTFAQLASTALSAEADCGASGNYALKDCVAALEWVRDNISVFGGDPSQVTIMGQSAGASLVSYLCVSPKAAGLFRSAVISSGNGLASSNLPTLAEVEAAGDKIIGDMTLEEMRKLTATKVSLLPVKGLGICIDGVYLTDVSAEMLRTGRSNPVYMMTGYVPGDTAMGGLTTTADENLYKEMVLEQFGQKCLDLYPSNGDAMAATAELYRDSQMGKLAYIRKLANQGNVGRDTYLWFFTHVQPGPNAEKNGAFHTSDIPYFTSIFTDLRKDYWTETDYAIGDKMSGYLVNFVKTCSPNGVDRNGNPLTQWDECGDSVSFLHIDAQDEAVELSPDKAAFWDEFYSNGGAPLF